MSRLFHRLSKLATVARQKGVRGVVSALRNFLLTAENRRWERRFGLDVQSTVHLDEVNIVGANQSQGFFYVPTAIPVIDLLLEQLSDEIAGFSFVDYGSGKGVVLLTASRFPFREVIGVEFAKELHDAALENIGKFESADERCSNVTSVLADAATFCLPENNCVCYFCNPFTEPVMRSVLENLETAHRQEGRKLYVLFNQLHHEDAESTAKTGDLLDNADFLQRREVKYGGVLAKLLMAHIDLRIYESVESAASAQKNASGQITESV